MAIMGFLAVANAYTMRVCLNIAITQMVHRRAHTGAANEGSCPGDVEQIATDPTVSSTVLYIFIVSGGILPCYLMGSANCC